MYDLVHASHSAHYVYFYSNLHIVLPAALYQAAERLAERLKYEKNKN